MGQPAARLADPALHVKGEGAILEGCASVRIENLPAARIDDPVQHNKDVETIVTGEPTVRIGGAGRLAARTGDKVGCGGCIGQASPTVRIGMTAEGQCLQTASDNATPYVQPARQAPAHGHALPPSAN